METFDVSSFQKKKITVGIQFFLVFCQTLNLYALMSKLNTDIEEQKHRKVYRPYNDREKISLLEWLDGGTST